MIKKDKHLDYKKNWRQIENGQRKKLIIRE